MAAQLAPQRNFVTHVALSANCTVAASPTTTSTPSTSASNMASSNPMDCSTSAHNHIDNEPEQAEQQFTERIESMVASDQQDSNDSPVQTATQIPPIEKTIGKDGFVRYRAAAGEVVLQDEESMDIEMNVTMSVASEVYHEETGGGADEDGCPSVEAIEEKIAEKIQLQQEQEQHEVQHTMLPKKYILQTSGPVVDGVCIDVLPLLESVDDGKSLEAGATSATVCNNSVPASPTDDSPVDSVSQQQLQQHHDQVAVVQATEDMEPHYITVTAIDDEEYAIQQDTNAHGTYHVQYVDSDHLYTTDSNVASGNGENGDQVGHGQTHLAYPLYTVDNYSATADVHAQHHHQQQQQHSDQQPQHTHYYPTASTPSYCNSPAPTGHDSQMQLQQQTQQHQHQHSQYIIAEHEHLLTPVTLIAASPPNSGGSSIHNTSTASTSLLHGNGGGGGRDSGPDSPLNCSATYHEQQQQQQLQHQPGHHGQSGDTGTPLSTPSPTNGDSKANLTNATRVAPATVAWLMENYESADGVSLPRSQIYSHYIRHCNQHHLDAVNAASFGKLIRSIFSGLRTRRLGTRGNSKYHYYGIRMKATSELHGQEAAGYGEDGLEILSNHSPTAGGRGSRSGGGSGGSVATASGTFDIHNSQQQQHQHQLRGRKSHERPAGQNAVDPHHHLHHQPHQPHPLQAHAAYAGLSAEKSEFELCIEYLGVGHGIIPSFPHIDMRQMQLTAGLSAEDVDTFRSMYREHCEAFLDAVQTMEFNTIQSLFSEFWRQNSGGGDSGDGGAGSADDECEEEKYLSKCKLFALVQCPAVLEYVRNVDHAFYQLIVEVLVPDVLRPIPPSLMLSARNFSKTVEGWLRTAMAGCPEAIVAIKMNAVAAFAQTLRRYTSLNHLAQAARAVVQNPNQMAQMLADLNKVDFPNVQEQASWVCHCDGAAVQRVEEELKAALSYNCSMEQWTHWLAFVVDRALRPFVADKEEYVRAARQFLLKWSFYSSMVIRDLTLRSAASFGSFHLIRLLYDEYVFYLIEKRVAEAKQTTTIAVLIESNVRHCERETMPKPFESRELQEMFGGANEFVGTECKQEGPDVKRMRS